MKIPETAEEIMEWACENYLPNFYERFNELQQQCSTHPQVIWECDKKQFYTENFPEALTAFAEQVAKEQREICAKNLRTIPLEESTIIDNLILSAPSPITKE